MKTDSIALSAAAAVRHCALELANTSHCTLYVGATTSMCEYLLRIGIDGLTALVRTAGPEFDVDEARFASSVEREAAAQAWERRAARHARARRAATHRLQGGRRAMARRALEAKLQADAEWHTASTRLPAGSTRNAA